MTVTRDPQVFRALQRAIVPTVQLPGWTAVVPERYAEPPDADRQDDAVALRTWDSDSVGTARLPVGLVRLHDLTPEDEPPAAWDVIGRWVTLWPDGSGTLVLRFCVPDGLSLAELRRETDLRCHSDDMTAEILRLAGSVSGAVHAALQGHCPVELRDEEPRLVGRHRLVRLHERVTEDLLRRVRNELVLMGRAEDFADVCGEEERACFPGNGVSVEIAPRLDDRPDLLGPVLEYYEHWIATTTTLDDELHAELDRLSRRTTPSRAQRSLALEARQQFFTHEDVLNAMSPGHLAVWRGLLPTWRVAELEQDIVRKVEVVDEVNRGLRESVANRLASRTKNVVTFLTALTLVSIVTGVAAFVLSEAELTPVLRVWLVAVSLLAAVTLFSLSVMPAAALRERSAESRAARRRQRRTTR